MRRLMQPHETESSKYTDARLRALPSPGDATASVEPTNLAQAFLRHATDCFLLLHDDGTIRYASDAAPRLLGRAAEALHGRALAELVHDEDAARLADFLAPHAAVRAGGAIEVRLRHGADWRLFAITSLELRDERQVDGRALGLRDVTAQREAARRSAAFLALGQQLGAARGAKAAARIIATVSDDLLGWDAYHLALYAHNDDLLLPVLTIDIIGEQRAEIPEVAPEGETPGPLSRRVMAGASELILRHGQQGDPPGLDPFGDEGRLSASLIYVPIRADETTVGILSIQSYTEDAYDDDDVALLQALADHCGGALERVRAEAALRASEHRLRHQATHDTLTGLANRALFQEELALALADPARQGRAMAVLFLDLDRFKVVNDSLGHEAGDALLVMVATRLRAALRPTDLAARLGGDEFTVLLTGIENVAGASLIAARIAARLTGAFPIDGHQVTVSASIGIALGVVGQDSPSELLRRADIALYRAKSDGRARYAVFDEAMSDAAVARLELEAALRSAIEHDEIRLHYQPLADLSTGRIIGVEALVRWPRGTGALAGPGSFIPIAEETGLILPLGRWVLHEACQQAQRWRTTGIAPDMQISVNLSAAEFAQPGLVTAVARTLRETGLDPAALELEITESAVMADADATIATLRALKTLGVRLAIDDFGTGYSSLAYLKRFPVDTLKIDKTFIAELGHAPEDEALLRAMIGIGQALGLRVVAEGLETEGHLRLLRGFGCDIGQGYHIARPGPVAAIAPLLVSPEIVRDDILGDALPAGVDVRARHVVDATANSGDTGLSR